MKTIKNQLTLNILLEYSAFTPLYHQTRLHFDLDENESFDTLKVKIWERTGIPVGAQVRLLNGGSYLTDPQKLMDFVSKSMYKSIYLMCKDNFDLSWDTSKAPQNHHIVLLGQFFDQLCNILSQGETADSIIQSYHSNVFSKIVSQTPSADVVPFKTELLDKIINRTRELMQAQKLPSGFIDFLTVDFLKDHQRGYTALLTKYQDDVLLHQSANNQDPSDTLIAQFKANFVQNLIKESVYIEHYKKPQLNNLQKRFLHPAPNLIEQTKEIEYYGDQRRELGEKYKHLRLFVLKMGEVFPLVKFTMEQMHHQEDYRFQLIIQDGHVTCFDIQISAEHHLSCCVLDSISGISDTGLLLLKKMHDELDCAVIHFVSTIYSPNRPQIHTQMQADQSNCMQFAVHMAVQAAKIPHFHDEARKGTQITSEKEKLKRIISPTASEDDFSWLECRSWSNVSPKLLKYSQSSTFFQGHHPSVHYTKREISRINEKISQSTATATTLKQVEPYLQGSIARQHFFLKQVSTPSVEIYCAHRIEKTVSPS